MEGGDNARDGPAALPAADSLTQRVRNMVVHRFSLELGFVHRKKRIYTVIIFKKGENNVEHIKEATFRRIFFRHTFIYNVLG